MRGHAFGVFGGRSCLARQRQPEGDLGAVADACAGRPHLAAVHLHQSPHQGQAQAQAAAVAVQAALLLAEGLEHAWQLGRLNPDARVRHRDHGPLAVPVQPHPNGDAATGVGELDGVVQQVADHLGQPRRVGLQLSKCFLRKGRADARA